MTILWFSCEKEPQKYIDGLCEACNKIACSASMYGPIMQKVEEAYNIIKDYDRWCQGYYQKDKDSKECPWREGYMFCGLGAIHYTCGIADQESTPAVATLQRISERLFDGKCLQQVNDISFDSLEISQEQRQQAHANVLRVYRVALELFKDRDPIEADWTWNSGTILHRKDFPSL